MWTDRSQIGHLNCACEINFLPLGLPRYRCQINPGVSPPGAKRFRNYFFSILPLILPLARPCLVSFPLDPFPVTGSNYQRSPRTSRLCLWIGGRANRRPLRRDNRFARYKWNGSGNAGADFNAVQRRGRNMSNELSRRVSKRRVTPLLFIV